MKQIILLHGAIGAKDQLQPLAEALTKCNYQVFSFSFSGHGQTSFQNNFDIEQFALELKQFIEKNKLSEPNIFGYSMGGYVALYLASQHSFLLGKIVTLGTKFNWNKEIAQTEVKQLDPKIILQKVPKFAEALKLRHGNDWEYLLERTAEMMIKMGNSNPLTDDLLLKIENQVMIGIADKDSMVTLDETVHVYKQLKNASMYMLPNTKHPIETVDVNALVVILQKFIN